MNTYNNIRKQNKTWSKVADLFVKFRQRACRGEGLLKEGHLYLVILAIFTVRGVPLDRAIKYAVIAFILVRIGHYLVGWWDETKLLIWQRESARNQRMYNPVMSKIDTIAKLLNIKTYKSKNVYENITGGYAQKYWIVNRLCHIYILYRQRTSRGESYMSDFQSFMNYGVVTGAIFIPDKLLPVIVIILQIIFFFIGWFDEVKLKLWQMEVARNSRVYNPVEVKLDKIEKKIKRMMNNEYKYATKES